MVYRKAGWKPCGCCCCVRGCCAGCVAGCAGRCWTGGCLAAAGGRAAAAGLASWVGASATAGVAPLLHETRNIPIVFVLVADPVGAGFVDSLAHPGGNATGFGALEYSSGSKWVELLKEIAPGVARVAIVRDPAISAGIGLFGAIQSAAASFSLEVVPIDVRDSTQIEGALATFARVPNGGLVLTAAGASAHRDLVIELAARHRLPAVSRSAASPARASRRNRSRSHRDRRWRRCRR